ncbi:MAG: hypothetical protein DRQ10_02745 [Candidatus Hydrothermota bacterium]|nr:MAG: hypothetical protein DRQ10_02745 [Candidatus Hydrothermae bacterium]
MEDLKKALLGAMIFGGAAMIGLIFWATRSFSEDLALWGWIISMAALTIVLIVSILTFRDIQQAEMESKAERMEWIKEFQTKGLSEERIEKLIRLAEDGKLLQSNTLEQSQSQSTSG